MALMYWPLYIAPTPGRNPRTAAVPGLGPDGGGGMPGAKPAATPATRVARQGSQKMFPCTVRTQAKQRGLPQFWQKATDAVSGWFAQFMPGSFGRTWLPARWLVDPGRGE